LTVLVIKRGKFYNHFFCTVSVIQKTLLSVALVQHSYCGIRKRCRIGFPSFSSAIRQPASSDCRFETSNPSKLGSDPTKAQALSNAAQRMSVSTESKKPRLKSRRILLSKVVITGPRTLLAESK
jgi:hypothetical protein